MNGISANGITENVPMVRYNFDIGVGTKMIGGVTIADNVRINASTMIVIRSYNDGNHVGSYSYYCVTGGET